MLVPPIEDLRDDRFVPGCPDDEMDVRGAHRVAIEELEEFPRGPIVGNRVGGRAQAVEAVFPIRARGEAPAEVEVHLRFVLLLVQPVWGGVPDVELGGGDGGVREVVLDEAVHVRVVAGGEVVHDAGVHGAARGVGAPEGAEDRGGGGEGGGGDGELGSNFVDEGFEAEDVAEELAFVAHGRGHPAGFVDLGGID